MTDYAAAEQLYVKWAGGKPDPTGNIPADETVSEVRLYEGLWKDVFGTSWMYSIGNPAAMNYGMRSGFAKLPIDDNVHYVKIGPFGYLVHESELSTTP